MVTHRLAVKQCCAEQGLLPLQVHTDSAADH